LLSFCIKMGEVLVNVADITYVQPELKSVCWRDGIFKQQASVWNAPKTTRVLEKINFNGFQVFLGPALCFTVLMVRYSQTYLTFRGPCIVIYSCNESRRDALFLNFILVKNSTCFGKIYCPSSGVLILYSQQHVFVVQGTLTVLADSQQSHWLLLQEFSDVSC